MRLLTAMLVICALVAAGCGDDNDTPPSGRTPATTPETTMTAAPSPPATQAPPTADDDCAGVGRILALNELGIAYDSGQPQGYRAVVVDDDASEPREVLIPRETDPTFCPAPIAESLKLAQDPQVIAAAEQWVRDQGFELVGECSPELTSGTGSDPARDDFCFFLPLFEEKMNTIVVGRPQSDDTRRLTLMLQADGSYAVTDVASPL